MRLFETQLRNQMKMTIDEQHKELMQILGWKDIQTRKFGVLTGVPPTASGLHCELPPLSLDLCHECEMRLTDDQHATFRMHLSEILERDGLLTNGVGNHYRGMTSANKEQRCEAILRTVGRWRE